MLCFFSLLTSDSVVLYSILKVSNLSYTLILVAQISPYNLVYNVLSIYEMVHFFLKVTMYFLHVLGNVLNEKHKLVLLLPQNYIWDFLVWFVWFV